MIQGRDLIFRELFGRDPSREELQKFDRIGALMGMEEDDSMWYVIIVNEFYDDRLRNRLAEVDRIADDAAEKALIRIAEAVSDKADMIAAQKNRGFMWQSWGLLVSVMVLLCAMTMNAGYVMGSGKYPFWLNPQNGFQQMAGWLLNVPAGWIFLLSTSPFLIGNLSDRMKKIAANKRMGTTKENPSLILKTLGEAAVLVLIVILVLSV